MKSIAKNFGKFNQMVGEKFAGASKHEVSEEFKALEKKTESRKEAAEAVLNTLTNFLKALEKKKEGHDKQKRVIIESLGLAMSNYGSELSDDSVFGQALLKVGETEERLSINQLDFANNIRTSLFRHLEEYMAEMKNYKHLKNKLENRRLDYDAKLNRLQKSKKEKPDLDEEMRIAQQKYEETLAEMEDLMVSLNDREDSQLESLLTFAEAQQRYHQNATEALAKLLVSLKDPSIQLKRKPRDTTTSRMTTVSGSNLDEEASPDRSKLTTPMRVGAAESEADGQSYLKPLGSQRAVSNRQLSDVSSASTIDPAGFQTPMGVTPAMSAFATANNSTLTSREPSSTQMMPPARGVPRKLMRVNYSFQAENKDELTINIGDLITVVKEVDEGWWIGELNGSRGLFPANYCQQVGESTESPPPAYIQPAVAPDANAGLPRSSSIPKFSYLGAGSKPPSNPSTPPSVRQALPSSVIPVQAPVVQVPMRHTKTAPPVIPQRDGLVNSGRNSSMTMPMSRSNSNSNLLPQSLEPAADVDPCVECGCQQWSESVFKKGQCNNCFHPHSH